MAYGHSFGPEFYYPSGREPRKTRRPTTVAEALASMSEKEWQAACKEVGLNPEYAGIDDMMTIVKETDLVTNLDSPVSVWIDPDGWHTVEVY